MSVSASSVRYSHPCWAWWWSEEYVVRSVMHGSLKMDSFGESGGVMNKRVRVRDVK